MKRYCTLGGLVGNTLARKHAAALIGMGLPEGLASMLADSSTQASRGALFGFPCSWGEPLFDCSGCLESG